MRHKTKAKGQKCKKGTGKEDDRLTRVEDYNNFWYCFDKRHEQKQFGEEKVFILQLTVHHLLKLNQRPRRNTIYWLWGLLNLLFHATQGTKNYIIPSSLGLPISTINEEKTLILAYRQSGGNIYHLIFPFSREF